MEVRGQSSGVGSLSTMWIQRTEFRSAGLAATTLTHWAISPVLKSFSVIKTNKQNHVEEKNSSAVRSTHNHLPTLVPRVLQPLLSPHSHGVHVVWCIHAGKTLLHIEL